MASREVFTAAAAARLEENRRRGGASPEKGKGTFMLSIFGIFPLLAVPVILYNILVFTNGGGPEALADGGPLISHMVSVLDGVAFTIPMVSGVKWQLTNGDLLIILSIAFLFVEILKSTSTGTATIMNHAVSMFLFIVCLVEFMMGAGFATSVFFIITVMALLDVLAGVVVTIVSARRDFAVGEGFGS